MSAQQSPATSPKNSSVQEKIELKPHEPALCIPRVFPNIKDRRIRAIFREAGLAEGDSGGEIDHIDFAKKTAPNGKEYNRVFIHFKTWPPGFEDLRIRLIQNAQQKNPLQPNEPHPQSFFKIIYDDPWFWTIFASTAKKHNSITRPKPKIVL
jgi:hypothetical protein